MDKYTLIGTFNQFNLNLSFSCNLYQKDNKFYIAYNDFNAKTISYFKEVNIENPQELTDMGLCFKALDATYSKQTKFKIGDEIFYSYQITEDNIIIDTISNLINFFKNVLTSDKLHLYVTDEKQYQIALENINAFLEEFDCQEKNLSL